MSFFEDDKQIVPQQSPITYQKSLGIVKKRAVTQTEQDIQLYKNKMLAFDMQVFRNSPLFKYISFQQLYQSLLIWNRRVKSKDNKYYSRLEIEGYKAIYQQLHRIQLFPVDQAIIQLDKLLNILPIRRIVKNNSFYSIKMPQPRASIRTLSLQKIYSNKNKLFFKATQKRLDKQQSEKEHKKVSAISEVCNHYRIQSENLKNAIQKIEIKSQVQQIFKAKARFIAEKIRMRRSQSIRLNPNEKDKEENKVISIQRGKSLSALNFGEVNDNILAQPIGACRQKQSIPRLDGLMLMKGGYQNKKTKNGRRSKPKLKIKKR